MFIMVPIAITLSNRGQILNILIYDKNEYVFLKLNINIDSQLLNKLTLSGYVTKRKVTKAIDGVDYEIQFFQGIHSNEYLVSQMSNGVYNGVSQLFDNGIIQYSCTFENGVRKGNVTTFKNGVADAVRSWESILSKDEEDRAIENRSIGMLLVIRDKETNKIIYEGGFNSDNHRNGYGFEFDRDSGDRQRYCYFEDDMVIQIICEFNGDKMIEYWIHEKDSNTKPYQKHPVYIGGFNIIGQQIVRHGDGIVIDALTGLAVFSGSWVNGVAINGHDLSDGWFCEGKKEVSLKMVVDEQTCELLEKQKTEEEEELQRKKEEEELRQKKAVEEEKLRQQQEAEEIVDIAEESIDVTITNVHDLEMLTPAVMLLITANNSCNSHITSLRLCEYPQLREIRIGDNCFKKVIIVKIMHNPLLESIIIGNNSFTYDKDTIEEDKTSILTISDNPLLSKILIDYLSFACFYTPVFESKNFHFLLI